MKILKANQKSIKQAISTLEKGGLVVYPTETCYGIAACATNSSGVSKLLEFKGKREGKISIAVSNKNMAKKYVNINNTADNLYDNFLPGPITVISTSKGKVDKRLESPEKSLGIRIPNHKFTLSLLNEYMKPITSTSANTSGKKQPYSLSDFKRYTSNKKVEMIGLFLDAGKLQNRPPSTVVDTTTNDIEVIRKGAITLTNFHTYNSLSENETIALGLKIMKSHQKHLTKTPLIIALQGDLGSGKTTLTKGIAKALKIKNIITSPTYTIIKEYKHSNGTLFHLDTWRLTNANEIENLGLNQMFNPGNVIVIEWLEKMTSILKKLESSYPILWITIKQPNLKSRVINTSIL